MMNQVSQVNPAKEYCPCARFHTTPGQLTKTPNEYSSMPVEEVKGFREVVQK